MHKLVKYFYQNKNKIMKIVLFVIFILLVIQVLNSISQKKQDDLYKQAQNDIDSGKSDTIDNSNYMISQGQTVKNSEDTKIKDSMKNFVEYCNNGSFENAYKMITDDCKNELFTNVQEFQESYINNVFSGKRNYSMQAWSKSYNMYTYLITYTEDILETGKKGNKTQEYYTFIKQKDGDYKISINNYIYKEVFDNIKTDNSDVNIEVLLKNVYKEYEIYEFKITNNSDKIILLNRDKNNSSLYLIDSDKVKYSSIQGELAGKDDILLEPGKNKKFKVKFNKVYNPSITIKGMVLKDVVMDYDEYLKEKDNGQEYTNIKSISVNF